MIYLLLAVAGAFAAPVALVVVLLCVALWDCIPLLRHSAPAATSAPRADGSSDVQGATCGLEDPPEGGWLKARGKRLV